MAPPAPAALLSGVGPLREAGAEPCQVRIQGPGGAWRATRPRCISPEPKSDWKRDFKSLAIPETLPLVTADLLEAAAARIFAGLPAPKRRRFEPAPEACRNRCPRCKGCRAAGSTYRAALGHESTPSWPTFSPVPVDPAKAMYGGWAPKPPQVEKTAVSADFTADTSGTFFLHPFTGTAAPSCQGRDARGDAPSPDSLLEDLWSRSAHDIDVLAQGVPEIDGIDDENFMDLLLDVV